VAMFLVGGGILTHGVPTLYHGIEHLAQHADLIPGVGVVLGALTPSLLNIVAGIVAGAVALTAVSAGGRIFRKA
jgi:predicted DNA repair protein MutK